MANPEHLAILGKGVKAWKQWRRDNETVRPDLREADLRGLAEGRVGVVSPKRPCPSPNEGQWRGAGRPENGPTEEERGQTWQRTQRTVSTPSRNVLFVAE